MPIRLVNIGLRFQSAGAWILHIFANMTGLEAGTALVVLLVVVGYIILLLILIPIHKLLVRGGKKKKEKLTQEYDTLRYLVAKAQKQSGTTTDHSGIKILFDKEGPDYFHHLAEIKQEIKNIEMSLGTTIVDDTTRVSIENKQKKYHSLKHFTTIYGWCVSVITVLVYKLFW